MAPSIYTLTVLELGRSRLVLYEILLFGQSLTPQNRRMSSAESVSFSVGFAFGLSMVAVMMDPVMPAKMGENINIR